MRVLLVTEKNNPDTNQRDGGARLVETLKQAFDQSMDIMQFGQKMDPTVKLSFEYPHKNENRFERRLANAHFIGEKIKEVEADYTHIIFIHISMQFGVTHLSFSKDKKIWTFPMFLTPSYLASGEVVPSEYTTMERRCLEGSQDIISPSYLEKEQLVEFYSVPQKQIHVIPRGVDRRFIVPIVRSYHSASPKFCSIGSIKPQKNTLGLIQLFAKIQKRFVDAELRIIGPVQNAEYYKKVLVEAEKLGISASIQYLGYLPSEKLFEAIEDCHIHLSSSVCETFGRSIFETLAAGLPNIVRVTGNAAGSYLDKLPYIKFEDDLDRSVELIEQLLCHISKISEMATEIGDLYDDQILSKLLFAKITKKDCLAVSDYDGTLYHKDDSEKTYRSIRNFQQFPVKVICTARALEDIIRELKLYELEVDWIIAYGGAVIANGHGHIISTTPIGKELQKLSPQGEQILLAGQVLQYKMPKELAPHIMGYRKELYQNTAYISHWKASKLHGVHKLLKHINWEGTVKVFGDGIYDEEILKYFDGCLVTSSSQIPEITD